MHYGNSKALDLNETSFSGMVSYHQLPYIIQYYFQKLFEQYQGAVEHNKMSIAF